MANVKVIAHEVGFIHNRLIQPGEVFYVTQEIYDNAGPDAWFKGDEEAAEELSIAKVKELLEARGIKFAANLGEKKLRALLAEAAASGKTKEEQDEEELA